MIKKTAKKLQQNDLVGNYDNQFLKWVTILVLSNQLSEHIVMVTAAWQHVTQYVPKDTGG